MLKVVLIDDDAGDRQRLSGLLAAYGPDLQIVAICSDVADAVRAIHAHRPDVVFTDIEMPGISGLQLLDFFNAGDVTFELIFTTSYSEFAVRAFRLSAIDYLLKPVEEGLLREAIGKVRRKQNYAPRERSELLRQHLAEQQQSRIAIPYAGGVSFVDLADIVYLRADNVYTDIKRRAAGVLTVSRPLKDFDTMLPKPQFFRCHRSYMVNLQEVKEYVTAQGGELIMKDGSTVPVARDRKEEFIALWQQIRL